MTRKTKAMLEEEIDQLKAEIERLRPSQKFTTRIAKAKRRANAARGDNQPRLFDIATSSKLQYAVIKPNGIVVMAYIPTEPEALEVARQKAPILKTTLRVVPMLTERK